VEPAVQPAPSAYHSVDPLVLTADDEESAAWAIVEDSERRRFGVSVVGPIDGLQLQVEWCMESRGLCLRYFAGEQRLQQTGGGWCSGCRVQLAAPGGKPIELTVLNWYAGMQLPPSAILDRALVKRLSHAARAVERRRALVAFSRAAGYDPADPYAVIADAAGFTTEFGCDGTVDLWLRVKRAARPVGGAPYWDSVPCVTTVDQSSRLPLRLPREVEWDRFFAGAILRTRARDDLNLLNLAPWAAAVRSANWTEPVARKLVAMVTQSDLDRLNRLRAALMLRYLRELGRTSGSPEPEDDRGTIFEELELLYPYCARRRASQ
jgi:hypothetical protein